MTLRPLPERWSDITPALLSDALGNSAEWGGGLVNAVTFKLIESPRGAVYRATVSCDRFGPVDLLVKLHNPDLPLEYRRQYGGEVTFYTRIAGRSTVPVPLTYVAEWDHETGRLLIVQEFLSSGRIGTASTLLNLTDQERILRVLARMHALWWDSPELHSLGIRTAGQAIQSGIDRFRSGELDPAGFVERFADRIRPEIADFYRRTDHAAIGERLRDAFSPHLTLCHYDVSAKNVFLPDKPERQPVFFDWALVVRGKAGHEIAQFISATTDPSEVDRIPELVRFYHEQLISYGVEGFGHETLWNDFRVACLMRLAAPVALSARGNPRAESLGLTLLPLVSATAIAVDAFAVLD